MLLSKYLTEYDEDLTGDVYIDPLGVQVIWSAYGQKIFQNKVNSISNDVRNYTLNLLNHAIIKSLIDDESVVLHPSLIEFIGEKRSLRFKQACLIYLENIFTYSVSNPGAPEGVNSAGVLGSSKANKEWAEQRGDPAIYFSAIERNGSQRYHLLVRQLGLGVSGRYKTPFSQIGFFEDHYDYHHPGASELWASVERLFKNPKLMGKVFEQARSHLVWLFENHTTKQQMPPKVCFSQVPYELIKAYQKALPNSAVAGQKTRDFWLEATELDKGAAGALLKALEASAKKREELSDPELFEKSLKHSLPEEEKKKLTDIQILEPLLGELDFLFQLARHHKKHLVSDVVSNWEKQGRNSDTLPRLANKVRETPGLIDVLDGTALKRLEWLLFVATQENIEFQLRELLVYHKRVMHVRGQQPWVELIDGGKLENHARTAKVEDRPLHSWVNNYYIPQFRNLVEGFRGVVE